MDGVSLLDNYTPASCESKVGLDRDICGANASHWSSRGKVIRCAKFKESSLWIRFHPSTPLPSPDVTTLTLTEGITGPELREHKYVVHTLTSR